MALAPLVYTLWNRVMMFDPLDPIWPNRDRFVLSNGHASMLLWSLLHLTGTRAVNSEYERFWASGGDARRHPPFSPDRQPGPWASRIPLGVGGRDHHGSSRQGVATERGHGDCGKWLANRYNRPGLEIFNYRYLCRLAETVSSSMEGISSEAASPQLILVSRIFAGSSTTTTSPSKGDQTLLSPRMLRPFRFPGDTGGTSCGWRDANDIERIEHALQRLSEDEGPSDIHCSGQPHWLWLPE